MFTSTSYRVLSALACVVAMSSCSHGTDGSASAEPGNSLDAAALLISIDDLRHVTGVPGLRGTEYDEQPNGVEGQIPAACRTDRIDVAYGQATQFKGMEFREVQPHSVIAGDQEVGIYPDNAAARAAFSRALDSNQQCSATHWGPFANLVVEPQDASNFTVRDRSSYALYRVRGPVVIMVSALDFADSEHVAQSVMQMISDRITSA